MSQTDAERQRRRRARARRGEIVAPVPICGSVIDSLVGLRWLDEHEAEDRVRIGDAIARLLSEMAAHR